jgi:alanine-synthesizing transaminase
MQSYFARRTSWDLSPNPYSVAVEAHRAAGREVLDLTASNPTTVGIVYRGDELLRGLAHTEALTYDPQPKGLPAAREAVAGYYRQQGSRVSADELVLTTSTSEGYSFVFRLLCDPGDTVLVPTPSYPLFDFLADLQDVKLARYELVYDHGWQIDFHSLRTAMAQARERGSRCRAVLVVHPNNPTGSYVKTQEAEELEGICAANQMAIIADEVFLDYSLGNERPRSFSDWQMTGPLDGKVGGGGALTFVLSGLSKISALPQMKVAWIAVGGEEALKKEAMQRLEVIADTYLSMNAPIQGAIPAMLEERHGVQQQLMERVRGNLAELDSQLQRQKLCQRLQVEGGWYAVLRVPATRSDEEIAILLLQQTGVLVQPGHFYDFAADGYLVLSLITPSEQFAEGIKRLLTFVANSSL